MKKYDYDYEGARHLSKLITMINKAIREAGCQSSIEAAQVARKVHEKVQLDLRYRSIYEEELFRLIAQELPFLNFKTELGNFLRSYKEKAQALKARDIEGDFPIKNFLTLSDWLPKIHPFCLTER